MDVASVPAIHQHGVEFVDDAQTLTLLDLVHEDVLHELCKVRSLVERLPCDDGLVPVKGEHAREQCDPLHQLGELGVWLSVEVGEQ